MSLTQTLAEFGATLRIDDIPKEVRRTARDHVLDTIGVSLACVDLPYMAILERCSSAPDPRGRSRVLGAGGRYPAQVAALLNGSLSHGNDYDDSFIEGIVHPSGPVLAAALAAFDPAIGDGADLCAAVVAGTEVTCRMALAIGPALLASGVHPTSACGVLGATVAAGRAARLDSGVVADALAFAASTAGGLHQSTLDGSWNKRVHGGLAARAAVMSCELAGAGMRAPRDVLEEGRGLFRTFGVARQVGPEIDAQLGMRWESAKAAIKVYPACQGVHPYVDCAIDIHRRDGFDIGDVRSVELRVGRKVGLLLCEPREERLRPSNGVAAKFSLPYTVAFALRHGKLTETAFDWTVPVDEEVFELSRRVTWEVDPAYDEGMAERGRVDLTTTAGEHITAETPHCRGTWQNPLSTAEVRQKFAANVGRRLGPAAQTIIDSVDDLESQPDLDRVFEASLGEPTSSVSATGPAR